MAIKIWKIVLHDSNLPQMCCQHATKDSEAIELARSGHSYHWAHEVFSLRFSAG